MPAGLSSTAGARRALQAAESARAGRLLRARFAKGSPSAACPRAPVRGQERALVCGCPGRRARARLCVPVRGEGARPPYRLGCSQAGGLHLPAAAAAAPPGPRAAPSRALRRRRAAAEPGLLPHHGACEAKAARARLPPPSRPPLEWWPSPAPRRLSPLAPRSERTICPAAGREASGLMTPPLHNAGSLRRRGSPPPAEVFNSYVERWPIDGRGGRRPRRNASSRRPLWSGR